LSFDPRLLPDAVAAGLAAVPFWEQGGRPHLLTGLEPGRDGLLALLQLARAVRDGADDLARQRPLAGRVVAGMFFDRSLRTRASMAVACAKLGAEFLDLEPGDSLWTLEFQDEVTMDGLAAEHVREAAGVLGRYADVVGLRSFAGRGRWERERTQPIHAAFAAHAGVPVVNLEGPFAHPCQGIADALTIQDLLPAGGGRVVLTWTPHPEQQPVSAPHSALWAATALGAEVVLARPKGFELDPEAVTHARALAAQAGGSLTVTDNRDEALADADIVYA
jgi:N-acetylornithine carbamoyltransferase